MNTIVISPDPCPFSDLTSRELLEELWEEGSKRKFKRDSPWSRKSGDCVRNYVFSNLRIQMKSTRPKVGWNLEVLWDKLPVEIIISIFELLHPIDLYHAIRATKALRRFLLNKNFAAIWKESFTNHPDIPMYPPDVTAPKWACLIFGPATCDVCGMKNCMVRYAFRCRECLCTGVDFFYFNEKNIANIIQPIIGESDLELDNIRNISTKTYNRSFEPYQYGTKPMYSLKEVTERGHEMRKYLLDIRSGTPDAEARYQIFLSIARAATQEREEHTRHCDLLAWMIYEKSRVTFTNSVTVLYAKGEKTLRKLEHGHDPRDVKSVQDMLRSQMLPYKSIEFLGSEISISRLRTIKAVIQECKSFRVFTAHAERVGARRAHVTSIYWNTVTFLTRDKMPYLPKPRQLYTHQFFADYIHDPKGSVDELDASSAQQEILRFIETSWAATKHQLLAILLETGLLPKETTADSNPDDFLGLAMAVFECCSNSVFFGWEDAGIHTECSNRKTVDIMASANSYRFSDPAYQALKNLAELLHLDLRYVLAKDLDALNKRFICKMCKFYWQAGPGLYAMTWRECLNHTKKLHASPTQKDPNHFVFDVLSEALTASILAIEQPPFPLSANPNWICQHCDILFKPVKKAEVVAHAREVHAITKPIKGMDFVYCPLENYRKRTTPLFIGLDEHSNRRCLRCPSSRRRLWKERDLFNHIFDKHGIQSKSLVEGVDWMKIKAVEDDSWIEEKMRDACGSDSYEYIKGCFYF